MKTNALFVLEIQPYKLNRNSMERQPQGAKQIFKD